MIHWRIWPKPGQLLPLILLTSIPVGGQDLSVYISLAYEGRIEEVAQAMPQLKQRYPNDGTVLFLEGLINLDGDAAVETFKKVVQLYPTSPYADDALLKIGEHLYARGLYVQAAQQLKQIPVHYPRSDLVYQSIRLFLNATLQAGDQDTARFYAQVFARKYPEMTFDLATGRAELAPRNMTPSATVTRERIRDPLSGAKQPDPVSSPPPPVLSSRVRLQAGAFGVRENAERRKELLESLNYRVNIDSLVSREQVLFRVTIEGLASREEAQRVREMLLEDYRIESYVLPME
ncbi:MAG: SPOR domain-containing protein [Candidatus Marinimicrobia bacterium]|nr:SPOR domain-containing protein [Candidatus Neomarinimicrobiota bacterium]